MPAFYYWKTTLALSAEERDYLDRLGCKKLYVKWLDVGRDGVSGEIAPYALLDVADTSALRGLEIIPAVFLTNAVFRNITDTESGRLAENMVRSLAEIPAALGRQEFPEEIQFDCDWTATTRGAYFRFLQNIKKRLPANTRLSATIRLHQYKFPNQTGVPPVDRGMLMFYNTGDIDDPETANSIFHPDDARKYVEGAPAPWPLPLDVALPVFSWLLVYRDGELWKIIPDVPESAWSDTSRFMPRAGAAPPYVREVTARNGTFLSGHYLRPGDLLRQEAITPAELSEAAALASRTGVTGGVAVAFFHLDTAALQRYPVQLLDSVCQMICLRDKNTR